MFPSFRYMWNADICVCVQNTSDRAHELHSRRRCHQQFRRWWQQAQSPITISRMWKSTKAKSLQWGKRSGGVEIRALIINAHKLTTVYWWQNCFLYLNIWCLLCDNSHTHTHTHSLTHTHTHTLTHTHTHSHTHTQSINQMDKGRHSFYRKHEASYTVARSPRPL